MLDVKVREVLPPSGLSNVWMVEFKLPRQRKWRMGIVMEMVDKKTKEKFWIVQADGTIMEVHEDGRCIYNTRGNYFMYLNSFMGAKKDTVSEDFIKILKDISIQKGDLIGVHPEGSPIYYGGGTTY